MRLDTTGAREATLAGAVLAPALSPAPPIEVPGLLRSAVNVGGEILGVLAIVLFIPAAIVAIGIPIALAARLVLWVGGLL